MTSSAEPSRHGCVCCWALLADSHDSHGWEPALQTDDLAVPAGRSSAEQLWQATHGFRMARLCAACPAQTGRAVPQVCRSNPAEKGRYIKFILALLQSTSTAVVYECAVTLVSLSQACPGWAAACARRTSAAAHRARPVLLGCCMPGLQLVLRATLHQTGVRSAARH